MALTKRQKDFLDFLAGFLEKNGYCPSYEEIADGLNLASLATVHKHILSLESKHYLSSDEQVEEVTLKKKKLHLKDQMEEILRAYRQGHAHPAPA